MRWIVLGGVLAASCGGATATSQVGRTGTNSAIAGPMPHEPCVSAAASGDVQQTDVNSDGRPDIKTVIRNGRPYCRETDANFDGRVDIARFFNAAGQTTRVEDDYDFDGRIDVVAMFENGAIHHDTLDTNFDGKTDTWRDYRNGHVVALRRDANNDGQVDLWERFDQDGRIVGSEVDANGDGQPDVESDAGYGVPAASASTPPAQNAAASVPVPTPGPAPASGGAGADRATTGAQAPSAPSGGSNQP